MILIHNSSPSFPDMLRLSRPAFPSRMAADRTTTAAAAVTTAMPRHEHGGFNIGLFMASSLFNVMCK